jgi:heme/copper-type cytochrome/quinol oxidase subunit 2
LPALLASFLTPDSPASPNAEGMQTIYIVMLVVVALLVLAINAALIGAIVRFRARRGEAPARRTAARGVVLRTARVMTGLALALFVVGIVFTESIREPEASGADGLQAAASRTAQVNVAPPPADSSTLNINAIGQQWLWRYEYPVKESDDQTFHPVFSYEKLVVPEDTTVILHVTSTDVVHRWSVPALAGKVDAVPGQYASTWFKADQAGETYDGRSYQYSGPGYATMRTQVEVVTADEYQTWIEEQQRLIKEAQSAVTDETETPAQSVKPQ